MAGMPARDDSPPAAAEEEEEERDLHTLAQLIFPHLPLSVQAITLPALSKAWKQWAQEQRAKERTLEGAETVGFLGLGDVFMFFVPLWAAQRQQLSEWQKRRAQLAAAAHGSAVCGVVWLRQSVADAVGRKCRGVGGRGR